MAFGQNMEEILLRVKAEGRGELDAVRQAYAQVIDGITKSGASLADGTITAKAYVKEISAANATLREFNKLLESAGSAKGGTAPEMLKLAEAAAKVAPEMAKLTQHVQEQQAATSKAIFEGTKQNMDAEVALFRQGQKEKVAAEKVAEKERLVNAKAAAKERADALRDEDREREYNIKQGLKAEEEKRRSLEQGRDASVKFGYSVLNVAHAVQDLQYGFGAVLNNIPLVVQAFGMGAGLAGTVMIAGVGVSVFGDKIKQLAKDMGAIRDPAKEGAVTIEQMETKLASIVEKPWKVDLDFRSIEQGKAEIAALEARLKAYQAALAKQTPLQEKAGKAVLEAVSEFAGAPDEAGGAANLGKVVEAFAERTGLQEAYMAADPRQKELQMYREQALAKTAPGMDASEVLAVQVASELAKKQAQALEAQMKADVRETIKADTIGSALRGGGEGLDRLIGMLETPGARKMLAEGDQARGILPADPKLLGKLREARPAEIRRGEAEDKANIDAADLVDREVERIKKAKEAQRKREEDETRELTKQGRVGEDAADEAKRIKGFMGAQYEFKPLEPFKRAVSPYERRQQALGRRRQSQQAAMGEQGEGLAQEVSQARPDLNAQQVIAVAGTANHLMAQGWNRNAALTQAILQLQQQAMQVMQMQQMQMNGFMGTVGQMKTQLNRMNPMQQRRNSLMPSPIPGRQR